MLQPRIIIHQSKLIKEIFKIPSPDQGDAGLFIKSIRFSMVKIKNLYLMLNAVGAYNFIFNFSIFKPNNMQKKVFFYLSWIIFMVNSLIAQTNKITWSENFATAGTTKDVKSKDAKGTKGLSKDMRGFAIIGAANGNIYAISTNNNKLAVAVFDNSMKIIRQKELHFNLEKKLYAFNINRDRTIMNDNLNMISDSYIAGNNLYFFIQNQYKFKTDVSYQLVMLKTDLELNEDKKTYVIEKAGELIKYPSVYFPSESNYTFQIKPSPDSTKHLICHLESPQNRMLNIKVYDKDFTHVLTENKVEIPNLDKPEPKRKNR